LLGQQNVLFGQQHVGGIPSLPTPRRSGLVQVARPTRGKAGGQTTDNLLRDFGMKKTFAVEPKKNFYLREQ